MKHGLEYITFHVQKLIAPLAMRSNPLVIRDKPLGAPAFVRHAYDVYSVSHTICSPFRRVVLFLYKDYSARTKYKTWRCHNKVESMKSFWVYYWYVKMPQCGYVKHRLEYITFHVQKLIAPLAIRSNSPLIRDKPLGAPAFVRHAYDVYSVSHTICSPFRRVALF